MPTDEAMSAVNGPRIANVAAEPARIDYASVFPAGVRAMIGLQCAVDAAGLEPLLLELVKMRASQINGCAYCLDMHSKDARALGESEQRLHLLAAWREASCYDARERAALAWCEALTLISERGAPDAVYEKVEQAFSAEEIVALTLAIVAINGWNRLAISMRAPVGAYVSPHRRTLAASAAAPGVALAGTRAKQVRASE
jgi:AhpD family alkylhydroperoxidase